MCIPSNWFSETILKGVLTQATLRLGLHLVLRFSVWKWTKEMD